MSDQLSEPVFIGRIGVGKALLPADAGVDQLAAVLRRALRTVECRELGPAAAQQKFGPFADTTEGRMTVFMDEDQLGTHRPGHEELQQLARAVRERGPAVDVVLVSPTPPMLLVDEVPHVVGESAGSAPGAPGWLYELRRPLRPVGWYASDAHTAADER
ncbi:hypothetical protein [Streptomyces sp. NPDC050485]|uniref:hypothetical protein n=1 Tax=Streptomyces sp. NPDC050485 TaxID=3365617 RepID=UPI003796F535